jgi:amino acid transporter
VRHAAAAHREIASMTRRASGGGKLGTFGGVFTPSVLTILGLILFLRLGFVVGHGGAREALAILGLATAISLLTSLSLSAIATNRRVRGGGDYCLISRSLGVAYGGALGLVLFVAQAVSVGFYCVGFSEAMSNMLGTPPGSGRAIAAGAAAALLGLAYLGSDLATRFQFGIMVLLGAALVSFFVGAGTRFDGAVLAQNWRVESSLGYWPLFAIFFPAVTGFTQGVSMSGDLKDPAKSLPLGTFLAVGVSTVVYAAAVLMLGGSLPATELASDASAMKQIARLPWLVDGGILAATLSSALASFLGAPRILQALAADRIFARLTPFAQGHGPSGNPRRAILLTGVIAFATIAVGSLNAIAGLVSMFFLISYGLLNYATYVEATAASPSFRPRFRFFHARASLLGTLLCGGVMLAIDPVTGIVATALIIAIHPYVDRTAIPAQWRDSRRAYRFRRVREGLRSIAAEPEGPPDWQPQVLVFTHGLERRTRVLRFASWMAGGSGLVTAASLIEAEGISAIARQRCKEIETELRAEIEELGLDIYPLAVAAPSIADGMATLVQSWGVGPIRSNTVFLNWFSEENAESTAAAELWYARMLSGAVRLGQHVVVLATDESNWEKLEKLRAEERRIDIWWFDDESSRLMLLLAHLMTRTESWDGAMLRVLVPAAADSKERIEGDVAKRLAEFRIEAAVEAIADPDRVRATSASAALVMMPLRLQPGSHRSC